MTNKKNARRLRFPAEFEPKESVWLGWPVYEIKKGYSSCTIFLELIGAMVQHMKVKLAVQDQKEALTVKTMLKSKGISLSNIEFHIIPHNDIWFRDMGPVFMVDDSGKFTIQKFGFNGWGYEAIDSERIALDRNVPALVAEQLGVALQSTEVVSEGGDREFNGSNVMITVEAVELQRNPGITREQLDVEFKHIFNVDNIIWLKQGLYEDTLAFDDVLPGPDGLKNVLTCITTGGHIDEHCRFVNKDTVLVAEVTEEEAARNPIARINRERMETNVAILKKFRSSDGLSLKIVRLPVPEPLYSTMHPGDGVYDYYLEKYATSGFISPLGQEISVIAASSYNNFFIGNAAIFAPRYWNPGLPKRIQEKDENAVRILKELFPGYAVYTFDVSLLNFGGGGIHCITQQQPVIKSGAVLHK